MKKLTIVNPSDQDFWKMPESYLNMIRKEFAHWEIRELKKFELELSLLKDAHAIIGLPFPANLIRGNPHLEWVHFLTAQIPLSWQKMSKKYIISNTKVSRDSVAEHALYLALKGIRKETFYHSRSWDKDNFGISKLASESTLGIIGFGNIGTKISELAQPLFKEIRFLTNRKDSPAHATLYSYDDKSFFKDLDVVIIATDHNEQTESFFNDPGFYQNLNEEIIIVNISRGELFIEKDLISFLTTNPKATYLADVTSPEPYPEDGELLTLSNVYLSPHVGGRFESIWPKHEKETLDIIKERNV
ncbi:MAG: NAD(P)-dependent oxidoreductase [Bacteriovoracaceae bacterium]